MPKKQRGVKLTLDERQELERFVAHGKKSAREITRARILLLTQGGRRVTEIAQTLGVSRGTIYIEATPRIGVRSSVRWASQRTPEGGGVRAQRRRLH
jgi:DNA-binding CsgD family transcriptional regulator